MQQPWIGDVQALTLDLDDTLWPIAPVIERAEQAMHAWLAARAAATASSHGLDGLRRLRAEVARDWPHRAHDLSALRLESIRRALVLAGDDEALAPQAFEVFQAERQRVQWFDDVAPALERLSRRFRLFAVSNGNADLEHTGLSRWFEGGLSGGRFGVAKPDARIFAAACEALALAPHQVVHAGDDPAADVAGARGAGLRTAWLRRPGSPHAGDACTADLHVPDMLALAQALGA
jgi:HAD superfamily hydrolase (TIGR01549 family)